MFPPSHMLGFGWYEIISDTTICDSCIPYNKILIFTVSGNACAVILVFLATYHKKFYCLILRSIRKYLEHSIIWCNYLRDAQSSFSCSGGRHRKSSCQLRQQSTRSELMHYVLAYCNSELLLLFWIFNKFCYFWGQNATCRIHTGMSVHVRYQCEKWLCRKVRWRFPY
jgi:hypothetical protein